MNTFTHTFTDTKLVVEAYMNMGQPPVEAAPAPAPTNEIEKGIEDFHNAPEDAFTEDEMTEKFDYFEALYAFATDYHSGQSSPGYRILSRIGKFFKPSPLFKGYDSLTEEGKEIYDGLVNKYADKF